MRERTWLQNVQLAEIDLQTVAGFIHKFVGERDEEAQLIRARYRYLRNELSAVKMYGSGSPENWKIKELVADCLRRYEREHASDSPS